MIEVGESLGNRYRVARAPEGLRAGSVFEVSDRTGVLVFGQVLAGSAVTPAMAQEVRGDLTVVAAMPSVLKPREIALSGAGIPVGILERPNLTRLIDRVTALDPEQKKTVPTALLRIFATLASDLAMLHQSGQVHGAITSEVVLTAASGELLVAMLSGFGVVNFARRLGTLRDEPSPRRDLVDLLNALHGIFVAAGVQPDGGAAAKWTLLRHAAMHGEHPALASGNALATQLNELAAIPVGDERATRPSRMPTINAPGRPRSSVIPGDPSGSLSPSRSVSPGPQRKTIPPAGKGSVRMEPPPRPKRARFSAGILVGGLAVIALLGSAAAYFIWDARAHRGDARLIQPRLLFAPPPCTNETPESLRALTLQRVAAQIEAVCADGRLLVVTREGTQLVAAQRAAARGQRYTPPLRIGESVVEVGAPIAVDNVAWVSWRNGVGTPFGAARIDAQGATRREIVITGWENVAAHGAALLWASERTVWLATTVVGEAGPHGVLIESTAGDHPRTRSWRLGDGEVVSTIPGPRATVLLDQHADNRHALRAVTLDLAAIEALAGAERVLSVRGADIPASAATTSEALQIEGDALITPRQGALTTAGARAFAVMTGASRPQESCGAPERCVGPGVVRLMTLPTTGAGTLVELVNRGWVEDLHADGGERVVVHVRTANAADAPVSTRRSISVEVGGAPSPPRLREAVGSARARAVRCGDDLWFVHELASPAGIAATPAACTERQPPP